MKPTVKAMRSSGAAFLVACVGTMATCLAQATRQADDAAAIYLGASAKFAQESPSGSVLDFSDHPPFGAEWDAIAAKAWAANRESFAVVREARSIERARWPADRKRDYLWKLHEISHQLSDAALHQHLLGNDKEAIELVRDLRHLSKLLYQDTERDGRRVVFASGLDMKAGRVLMIIAPGLDLAAADDERKDAVTIDAVKQLIRELLDESKLEPYQKRVLAEAHLLEGRRAPDEEHSEYPFAERYAQGRIELSFAAVSLACRLYRNEHGRWPTTLRDLVPDQLPNVPIDPWAKDNAPLGYVIIKGGLPDGADRPLVYSRMRSRDGLAYRADAPQYMFYALDGSDRAGSKHKQAGQFRDIARWHAKPPAVRPAEPTMQPLPEQ